MDELKLFSLGETELQKDLTIFKTFGEIIRMEFGQDKCTTPVYKHGRLSKNQNFSRSNQTVRRNVRLDEIFIFIFILSVSVVGKNLFVELESACNAASVGLCVCMKQGKESYQISRSMMRWESLVLCAERS
jgi:hypothetical protein